MAFQIKLKLTPEFGRTVKRLTKKYHSLPSDINDILQKLQAHPQMGDALGHSCYKVRLPIASKGKGKSGGGRIITYVQIVGETIVLLALYDKSEQDSISDKEVLALLTRLEE